MVWKVERFKYKKMGKKGVHFGYLKFLRTFRGKVCPHVRVPVPLAPSRHWSTGASVSMGPIFLDWATITSLWTGCGCGSCGCRRNPKSKLGHADAVKNPTLPSARPPISKSRQLTPRTETILSSFICQNSFDCSIRTVTTAPSNEKSGAL